MVALDQFRHLGRAAEFLSLLGAADTPGALFAIGASLALRPARRVGPALALSGVKLVLHPLAVAAGFALLAALGRVLQRTGEADPREPRS